MTKAALTKTLPHMHTHPIRPFPTTTYNCQNGSQELHLSSTISLPIFKSRCPSQNTPNFKELASKISTSVYNVFLANNSIISLTQIHKY